MSEVLEPDDGQSASREAPLNESAPSPAASDPPSVRPDSESTSEMEAIDREVAEAMGSMDPRDLAELCGEATEGAEAVMQKG